MRYIVFDTETTGVSAEKQAVEVALLELDESLNVLGEAESLIQPTVFIDEKAQKVHGITFDMLADKPTIYEWVDQTFGGRLEGEVTLIGHKVSFDRPLFDPIGDVARTMDTLIHAQVAFPDAPNHKLETLRDFLGLEVSGDSHRAMADVKVTYQLLQRIVDKSGRSLEDLAAVQRMFLHKFPWGKHAGKSIWSIPKGYRDWCLTIDIDPNLRYTLEQVAQADIKLPAPHAMPKGTRPRIIIPKRTT